MDIRSIIREYYKYFECYELFYAYKSDNLFDMDQLFEKHNQSKLAQEETNNPNSFRSIK